MYEHMYHPEGAKGPQTFSGITRRPAAFFVRDLPNLVRVWDFQRVRRSRADRGGRNST
jgi:hypothetical protein